MSSPTVITFAKSLYDADALAQSIDAYEALAGFVVEESPDELRVTITDPHPDVADLTDHFANHVLWATITTRRRNEEAAQ